MGCPLQRTHSQKLNHSRADSFPACWKPVLWLIAAVTGFPLADSRNWHTTTDLLNYSGRPVSCCSCNSSKLISGYSCQLFAAGAPLIKISHIFFFIFLRFKGWGCFKFFKEFPAAKQWSHTYRLVLIFTHLSFRWTVPLVRSAPLNFVQIHNLRITAFFA